MKILVTGGAGFIGSHLVDALLTDGHDVVVLDNLSTGKTENLTSARSFDRFSFAELDIRDELETFFKKHAFQAVYHLAAQANVQRSIVDPALDAEININGTVNLLETAKISGVERFVFASSVAIYGESGGETVDETKPSAPLSPYGVSKATAMRYLSYFQQTDTFFVDSLVLANVYGPRQDPGGEGGVVAVFADRMVRGISPVIFGTGQQTRDFVYVKDVAEAFRLCLNKTDQASENIINIGTGRGMAVEELFQTLKVITGFEGEAVRQPARSGDITGMRVATRRAIEKLGWEAKTVLKEGLKPTIQWFKSLER
jgi:UDP-glucose 4-epimerase